MHVLLHGQSGLRRLCRYRQKNLIAQLTAPVRWTQTAKNMIEGGATLFTEIGPGKVLQGLIKKVDKAAEVAGVQSFE